MGPCEVAAAVCDLPSLPVSLSSWPRCFLCCFGSWVPPLFSCSAGAECLCVFGGGGVGVGAVAVPDLARRHVWDVCLPNGCG